MALLLAFEPARLDIFLLEGVERVPVWSAAAPVPPRGTPQYHLSLPLTRCHRQANGVGHRSERRSARAVQEAALCRQRAVLEGKVPRGTRGK
jgi:hypothetical protein